MKEKSLISSLLVLILFIFPAVFSLSAQDAEVIYMEGWVDIKKGSGDQFEAFIGDELVYGDTVITGKDGQAELKQAGVNTVIVSPDTIFRIEQKESGGEKKNIFSCIFGAVSFKFSQLFGSEPGISTPSSTAGVRGTEFTVFSALDGSSLITVSSGLVAVEAEGTLRELSAMEGVEIRPGEAPGEKFEVLRGKIDFEDWYDKKSREFMDDPVGSILRAEQRLETLQTEIDILTPLYKENTIRLIELREDLKKVREDKTVEEFKKYRDENVTPVAIETSNQFLNIRYYTLSSLSLRRWILGKMYLTMKTSFYGNYKNPLYKDFLDVYYRILDKFESGIVLNLVDADI